jgi:hypothetical protein
MKRTFLQHLAAALKTSMGAVLEGVDIDALVSEAAKQSDEHNKPNGGRNRHPAIKKRHTSRTKPKKRARAVARRRK